MKKFITLLLILNIMPICQAKHLFPEKYYQNLWCDKHKGITEFKLNDNTRVDCLTDKYAVEFDFAPKYHECLGQALHYAARTNKQSVCLLILEKPEQMKYVYRLRKTIQRKNLNVKVLTIKTPAINIVNEDVL